jgi:outer membrane receptor protein involved in Fe transport
LQTKELLSKDENFKDYYFTLNKETVIGLLNNANYVFGNALVNGIGRSTLNNDKLSWESKKQFDIGLDFGLFNDRIYGGFDYYNSVTSDLLLNVNIASSAGFTTALTNVGEVENKGVEFTLNTRNTVGKFQWSTDFNISANRNKVLKLGPTGSKIFIAALLMSKKIFPIASIFPAYSEPGTNGRGGFIWYLF